VRVFSALRRVTAVICEPDAVVSCSVATCSKFPVPGPDWRLRPVRQPMPPGAIPPLTPARRGGNASFPDTHDQRPIRIAIAPPKTSVSRYQRLADAPRLRYAGHSQADGLQLDQPPGRSFPLVDTGEYLSTSSLVRSRRRTPCHPLQFRIGGRHTAARHHIGQGLPVFLPVTRRERRSPEPYALLLTAGEQVLGLRRRAPHLWHG